MGWQDRAYNRDDNGGIPPVQFRFPKPTRLTGGLIGACLLVFLVQAFTRESGSPLERWGSLSFFEHRAFAQPWRWITYQYLHASAGHFFFNMLGLYFFVPSLELMWGWRKTLAFYTAGGVAGGLVFGLLVLFTPLGERAWLVGASGSIFAALGAVALLLPERQLILLFFPLPIRVAAALFGAFFLLSTIADKDFGDAAHLGGLAFGFFAPYLAGPVLNRTRRRYAEGRVRRAVESERDEQEGVDRILAKVHAQGMNSLTRTERKYLERATANQRKRDADREKNFERKFGR